MSERYLDLVLRGEALWTDIDDWVDRWHELEGQSEPLHDYLGLTWDDYSLWVEQPSTLRLIIAAHERDEPVLDLAAHADDYALAARGDLTPAEAATVRKWLQETGRIPRS